MGPNDRSTLPWVGTGSDSPRSAGNRLDAAPGAVDMGRSAGHRSATRSVDAPAPAVCARRRFACAGGGHWRVPCPGVANGDYFRDAHARAEVSRSGDLTRSVCLRAAGFALWLSSRYPRPGMAAGRVAHQRYCRRRPADCRVGRPARVSRAAAHGPRRRSAGRP